MPRFLIVGAGAVGQPLAAHLAAGGASVSFLVKEKYGSELRENPITLHWLSICPCLQGRRYEFRNFGIVTSPQEAAAEEWDAVILTVASTALRQGQWLQEVVDLLVKPRPASALVFLTSGMSDRGLLDAVGVPARQLVQGGILLIAWQAPLEGERFSPVKAVERAGTTKATGVVGYILPEFVLSGPSEHTAPLARVMKAGRMKCHIVLDTEVQMAFPEAVLMPILVALEVEGWSFQQMRRGRRLADTAAAVRECLAVAQREAGPSCFWRAVSVMLMHGWLIWLLLLLSPLVMPFDFEVYLKYHFCKVGDQTKQYIDEFVQRGRSHDGEGAMPRLRLLMHDNPRWLRPATPGDAIPLEK